MIWGKKLLGTESDDKLKYQLSSTMEIQPPLWLFVVYCSYEDVVSWGTTSQFYDRTIALVF